MKKIISQLFFIILLIKQVIAETNSIVITKVEGFGNGFNGAIAGIDKNLMPLAIIFGILLLIPTLILIRLYYIYYKKHGKI